MSEPVVRDRFAGFEKITKVSLPFDMRHADPKRNYGIHGLDIWFILKGPKGAVQFAVNFRTYLPHVAKELGFKSRLLDESISGIDVGYHSPVPQFEGQHIMPGECDVLGGHCYYDGSSLQAQDWVEEIFSIRGSRPEERVWEKLLGEYIARFGESTPEPPFDDTYDYGSQQPKNLGVDE